MLTIVNPIYKLTYIAIKYQPTTDNFILSVPPIT